MTKMVPYDELDPGVRRLVRLLNDHGFDTCDSGDGKSKFGADGKPLPGWESESDEFTWVLDVPHVAMMCDPADLVTECDRLRDVLTGAGVELSQQDGHGKVPCIQGSYDPCYPDRFGVIVVSGVDDSMLA